MATARPSLRGVLTDLARRQSAELHQRQRAQNILTPEHIGTRSGITTARLLHTTLGGQLRAISAEDLRTFKARARALGKEFQAGLTAKDVVDLSTPADRERARDQIRTAIPTRLTKGHVLFTTPSGPGSRVTRHLVTVEWPGYGQAVSLPGTPLQAARALTEQHLRFDCDCEHHRFRFRFIASVLGCNAGRPEVGFPKITNPSLIGVACKHVLRVMVSLEQAGVRALLAKMIEADRNQLETPGARARVITATAAQANRVATAKPKAIRTTTERERLQAVSAIRKAMPKVSGSASAQINSTLAALRARPDVTAQSLLAALNALLKPGARA